MIRFCKKSDISWMVELSHLKRAAYEKHQRQFWKMSKNSDEIQVKWFEELLEMDDVIALVCENKKGFIIGKIINPPEVYDAGLTLMIDDFCVEVESSWMSVGKDLINEIKKIAKSKNVTQMLVVCGAHDEIKNKFLKDMNLTIASNWHVKSI